MNKTQAEYQEKIQHYLKGELSGEEEKMLFDWLDESSENYDSFQTIVRENEFKIATTEDAEKAWLRFRAHINEQKPQNKRNILFIRRHWIQAAAVLLLALLAGFFGNSYLNRLQSNKQFCELIVPYGDKKQIDLSDGSKIWLNAGTKLRYPKKFVGETRNIEIDGEGFFEVAKDKSHPFIISTPTFEVKVLGTTFNLSTYPDDESNSLSLLSGSVQLSTKDNRQKLMLVPGEKAVLDKSSKSIQVVPIDTENPESWRNGILEFRNLRLTEISKLLERRFNVKIQIRKEELKQIKFSGQFKSDEGLDKLLDILKQTSPIKIKYKHTNKEEIIIE